MAKGDDSFKRDVKDAVDAGSDFSQGGDQAHKALMAKLAQDAQKPEYNDPAKFNKLGESVAEGLRANGKLDEHSVRWIRDNMSRFDTSGDGKVNYDELDPRNPIAVNGLEKAMMGRLQEIYGSLNTQQELKRKVPIFGQRGEDNEFSHKDFNKLVNAYERPRTEERENRQQSELAERKQAQKDEVSSALLRNDGDPRRSLAAVLDTQRSDKPDGEISRKDIRKFIANYNDGESRGDFGYTPDNLRAARLLDSQWDDDLGKSLRGQYDRHNGGRDHNGQPDKITYGEIDLKRLAEMRGQSVDDMWASNATGASRNERVAETQTGVRPVQADNRTGSARPVLDDQGVVVDSSNRPVVDSSGQPVRTGEVTNQGRVRPLKPDNEEATVSRRPEKDDVVTPTRRPLKDDGDAKTDGQTTPRPVSRFEAAKPIPELVMPEIKEGDDVAKVREAFAKSAEEHFKARADYTVQPGQGWDRIARDVLRQEKDGSHSNEPRVVALSEALAKHNGWGGRLDQNKMLQPGDVVNVMTPEMVQARVEASMKQFDAKALEIANAAKKKAEEEQPSQFDGKRNGENLPVDTTKVPVDTTKVPVDTTKVPVDTTKVPVDTTKVPVDTTKVPVDTTKVPVDTTKVPVDTTKAPVDTKASVDANKVETSILSSKDNVNPEDDAYVASVSATNQSIARDKANRDRIAREKADRERLAKSSSQAEKPDFENFVVS